MLCPVLCLVAVFGGSCMAVLGNRELVAFLWFGLCRVLSVSECLLFLLVSLVGSYL